MAKTHLHRQTVSIALVCAAAVGVTVAYVHWQTPQNQGLGQTAIEAGTTSPPIVSSYDWKKDFFSSSAIDKTVTSGSKTSASADAPLTITGQMGRNFFARFIQLKQSGLDGDPQMVQDTVNQTLDEAASSASVPKKYAVSDIIVSPKTDAASLRAYGNAIGTIFMVTPPAQNPVLIASEAFNSGNMALLSQLDPIVAWYKKSVSGLVAISVPQSAVQAHLDMLNALSIMLYVSQSLRNTQGDPMQSILAVGMYTRAQQATVASIGEMSSYFNGNNISFSTSEPGVVLSALANKLQSL